MLLKRGDTMGLAAFQRMRRLQASQEERKSVDLEKLTVPELKDIAKEKGISGYSKMNRDDLLEVLGGE
ncbi:Rho termination factor N-terminal domain-containing protein [Bacillus toyonensis]|uniref:Rho termination factor N-terminal domain-containing protein n=2 Tax=Bacillus toyonensis TaxID=155322 RepID=UPI001145F206|nr:Rho termination factor N-terminal domain-containing protein [Bacillus toyonensis]